MILLLFLGQLQISWQQAGSIDRRYPVFRSIGQWLSAHTPPGSSVGALEIGVIGYYAGRPIIDFAGLIQPDVTLQLLGSSSYEGAALWAVQRYHPDYLVLRDGLFPDLEAGYVASHCQVVHKNPTTSGENPHSISIYDCRLGE
jgi:hypothetical protein